MLYPLIAAGVASVFCLETKGTKTSRNNDAPTSLGHTPGSPFFHPTARVVWFIWYLFFSSRFFKYYYCLNWDFRRHAFSPQQLLNKKQKIGLVYRPKKSLQFLI